MREPRRWRRWLRARHSPPALAARPEPAQVLLLLLAVRLEPAQLLLLQLAVRLEPAQVLLLQLAARLPLLQPQQLAP